MAKTASATRAGADLRRLGAARGQVLDFDGRAVIATIHPSAVLRAQEPADRDEQYAGLVADLRRAVEVSEKENR